MNNLKLILFLCLFYSNAFASEAIGFYSSGSLNGSQSVFERGTPVHKLFLNRGRHYTTDEMHRVLSGAAEFLSVQFPNSEVLQVGDLSGPAGGVATGHASHQNGLDADLVYLRKNGYVQSPKATSWDEDFVTGVKPSGNFNVEKNFALFAQLISTEPVARIFVDAAIKKSLCNYVLGSALKNDPKALETLRRLRPQDLHRTHFHIRLSCPSNDKKCTQQAEPPAGTGCDEFSLLNEVAFVQTC